MVKEISYIIITETFKKGRDWPTTVKAEAFVPGNNLKPQFLGAGPDLDSALNPISHFTGQSIDCLKSKIYQ